MMSGQEKAACPVLSVGEAIAAAMFKSPGMGGPIEPITDLYRPEGVVLIVAHALGIDPAMTVREAQRRLSCSCLIRCATCGDTGTVHRIDGDSHDYPYYSSQSPCPDCDGSGRDITEDPS